MTHLGDEASYEQAYDYLMRRQNVPKYSLLICEEFGIGICVTYSQVQRRYPWVLLARSARFVDARAERSERGASEGRADPGRRKEGNEEERRRKKVKKTRASWRRLFAWVSLGGRRVCLVESAADL